MSLPLLQVALDNFTISEALESTSVLAPELDVVEVGTLLCLSTGAESISTMRTLYPENKIVADLKIVDAGGELADMACSKGADWVTVMCNAANATKAKAVEAAGKLGGEMQVELFGNWTFEEAEEWKKIGLKQLIYHQSRDALNSGGSWGEANMKVVKRLAEMGFESIRYRRSDNRSHQAFQRHPRQMLYRRQKPAECIGSCCRSQSMERRDP